MSQSHLLSKPSRNAQRRQGRKAGTVAGPRASQNASRPDPAPRSQSKHVPKPVDEKPEPEDAEAEKSLAKRLEGKQLEDEKPLATQPEAEKPSHEPGSTIRDWYRRAGGDEKAMDKVEKLIAAVMKTGVHLRRSNTNVDYPGRPDEWEDPPPSVRGDVPPTFTGAVWLRQVAQERGDMHDIRAALYLRRGDSSNKRLRVIITMDSPLQVSDIREIVDYYGGFGTQVLLYLGRHDIPNTVHRASQATEILYRATDDGARDISGDLQDATAASTKGLEDLYDRLLQVPFRLLPKGSLPYALINYRTSGHGTFQVGGRSPSHPELDTGTEGFKQLWRLAEKKGYQPIPTGGDIPEAVLKAVGFNDTHDPSLIDYFLATKPLAAEARDKRKIDLPDRMFEYGVFRRIRELFPNAIAIGMRSGGLDAIAFSGIPVVSVDIKTDELDLSGRKDLDPEFLDERYGHHNSWRRAEKRKAILPGTFQQAFMTSLRTGAGTSKAPFEGELDEGSLHEIGTTIAKGFGAGSRAGTKSEFIRDQDATAKLNRYGARVQEREERERQDALRKQLTTPIAKDVTGVVTRVNDNGSGFIQRNDDRSVVYVRAGAVEGGLKLKMRLKFDVFTSQPKPRAGNVRLIRAPRSANRF